MPRWLKNTSIFMVALVIAGIWGGIATLFGIHRMIQVIVVIFIGGIAISLMAEKNSN